MLGANSTTSTPNGSHSDDGYNIFQKQDDLNNYQYKVLKEGNVGEKDDGYDIPSSYPDNVNHHHHHNKSLLLRCGDHRIFYTNHNVKTIQWLQCEDTLSQNSNISQIGGNKSSLGARSTSMMDEDEENAPNNEFHFSLPLFITTSYNQSKDFISLNTFTRVKQDKVTNSMFHDKFMASNMDNEVGIQSVELDLKQLHTLQVKHQICDSFVFNNQNILVSDIKGSLHRFKLINYPSSSFASTSPMLELDHTWSNIHGQNNDTYSGIALNSIDVCSSSVLIGSSNHVNTSQNYYSVITGCDDGSVFLIYQDRTSLLAKSPLPISDVKYLQSSLSTSETGANVKFVTASGGQAKCWDASHSSVKSVITLKDLQNGSNGSSINCIAVHPSRFDIIATGSSDGVLRIWDIRYPDSSLFTLQYNESALWKIKFCKTDPRNLISTSEDGSLLAWNITNLSQNSSSYKDIGSGNNGGIDWFGVHQKKMEQQQKPKLRLEYQSVSALNSFDYMIDQDDQKTYHLLFGGDNGLVGYSVMKDSS